MANNIEIDRIIHCKSYVPNELKNNLMRENGNIFAVADEKVNANLKNIPLECNAKQCIYNKGQRCHANGIAVIDGATGESETETPSAKADCATYCGG